MAAYRVWKLRESQRQHFRNQEHMGGAATVKPRDYTEGGLHEAAGPYELWNQLKGTPDALQVGDVVASEAGELVVFKFIGFESAQWLLMEPKQRIDEKVEGDAVSTPRSSDTL
jgi:hypothetical protein